MLARVVESRTRDVLWFLVGATGEPFGADLCGNGFQLLDRCGAVDVAGDRQHFLFALLD